MTAKFQAWGKIFDVNFALALADPGKNLPVAMLSLVVALLSLPLLFSLN